MNEASSGSDLKRSVKDIAKWVDTAEEQSWNPSDTHETWKKQQQTKLQQLQQQLQKTWELQTALRRDIANDEVQERNLNMSIVLKADAAPTYDERFGSLTGILRLLVHGYVVFIAGVFCLSWAVSFALGAVGCATIAVTAINLLSWVSAAGRASEPLSLAEDLDQANIDIDLAKKALTHCDVSYMLRRSGSAGGWETTFITEHDPTTRSNLIEKGTQAAVRWNAEQKRLVIVFRGSDSNADLLVTDTNVRLAKEKGFPGRVHAGFAKAFRAQTKNEGAVVDAITRAAAEYILEADAILVTGHSLGGALAVLYCVHLTHNPSLLRGDCLQKIRLVTFGCPMVGDAAFAKAADDLLGGHHERWVNRSDIVTSVPPYVPLLLPYTHTGKPRHMAHPERGVGHTFNMQATDCNQLLDAPSSVRKNPGSKAGGRNSTTSAVSGASGQHLSASSKERNRLPSSDSYASDSTMFETSHAGEPPHSERLATVLSEISDFSESAFEATNEVGLPGNFDDDAIHGGTWNGLTTKLTVKDGAAESERTPQLESYRFGLSNEELSDVGSERSYGDGSPRQRPSNKKQVGKPTAGHHPNSSESRVPAHTQLPEASNGSKEASRTAMPPASNGTKSLQKSAPAAPSGIPAAGGDRLPRSAALPPDEVRSALKIQRAFRGHRHRQLHVKQLFRSAVALQKVVRMMLAKAELRRRKTAATRVPGGKQPANTPSDFPDGFVEEEEVNGDRVANTNGPNHQVAAKSREPNKSVPVAPNGIPASAVEPLHPEDSSALKIQRAFRGHRHRQLHVQQLFRSAVALQKIVRMMLAKAEVRRRKTALTRSPFRKRPANMPSVILDAFIEDRFDHTHINASNASNQVGADQVSEAAGNEFRAHLSVLSDRPMTELGSAKCPPLACVMPTLPPPGCIASPLLVKPITSFSDSARATSSFRTSKDRQAHFSPSTCNPIKTAAKRGGVAVTSPACSAFFGKSPLERLAEISGEDTVLQESIRSISSPEQKTPLQRLMQASTHDGPPHLEVPALMLSHSSVRSFDTPQSVALFYPSPEPQHQSVAVDAPVVPAFHLPPDTRRKQARNQEREVPSPDVNDDASQSSIPDSNADLDVLACAEAHIIQAREVRVGENTLRAEDGKAAVYNGGVRQSSFSAAHFEPHTRVLYAGERDEGKEKLFQLGEEDLDCALDELSAFFEGIGVAHDIRPRAGGGSGEGDQPSAEASFQPATGVKSGQAGVKPLADDTTALSEMSTATKQDGSHASPQSVGIIAVDTPRTQQTTSPLHEISRDSPKTAASPVMQVVADIDSPPARASLVVRDDTFQEREAISSENLHAGIVERDNQHQADRRQHQADAPSPDSSSGDLSDGEDRLGISAITSAPASIKALSLSLNLAELAQDKSLANGDVAASNSTSPQYVLSQAVHQAKPAAARGSPLGPQKLLCASEGSPTLSCSLAKDDSFKPMTPGHGAERPPPSPHSRPPPSPRNPRRGSTSAPTPHAGGLSPFSLTSPLGVSTNQQPQTGASARQWEPARMPSLDAGQNPVHLEADTTDWLGDSVCEPHSHAHEASAPPQSAGQPTAPTMLPDKSACNGAGLSEPECQASAAGYGEAATEVDEAATTGHESPASHDDCTPGRRILRGLPVGAVLAATSPSHGSSVDSALQGEPTLVQKFLSEAATINHAAARDRLVSACDVPAPAETTTADAVGVPVPPAYDELTAYGAHHHSFPRNHTNQRGEPEHSRLRGVDSDRALKSDFHSTGGVVLPHMFSRASSLPPCDSLKGLRHSLDAEPRPAGGAPEQAGERRVRVAEILASAQSGGGAPSRPRPAVRPPSKFSTLRVTRNVSQFRSQASGLAAAGTQPPPPPPLYQKQAFLHAAGSPQRHSAASPVANSALKRRQRLAGLWSRHDLGGPSAGPESLLSVQKLEVKSLSPRNPHDEGQPAAAPSGATAGPIPRAVFLTQRPGSPSAGLPPPGHPHPSQADLKAHRKPQPQGRAAAAGQPATQPRGASPGCGNIFSQEDERDAPAGPAERPGAGPSTRTFPKDGRSTPQAHLNRQAVETIVRRREPGVVGSVKNGAEGPADNESKPLRVGNSHSPSSPQSRLSGGSLSAASANARIRKHRLLVKSSMQVPPPSLQ
ncbi:Phospholipase A1-II 4 [Diplonema papillatum]|nr:Phospholipase A1-II 4 [Diplonema papillatum]